MAKSEAVTLEQLIKSGAIPKDCKPATVEKTATVSLDEVEANQYKVPEGKIIVAENYNWVAYSATKDVYFSANKNGKIIRYDVAHKSCSVQTFKSGRLKTTKNTNLKTRKDVLKMEDVKLQGLEGLEDLDLGAGLDLGGNENTEKLDVFNGTESKETPNNTADEERKAKEERDREKKTKLEQMISSDVEGIKLADITILSEFNRRHGRLIGYITLNDSLIKFGTSTVILKDPVSKKPRLSANASPAVRDAVNRGQSIAGYAKTNFVTETSLTKKQTTPGKVLGTVISIPEGGNIPLADLFAQDRVKPDETKKDKQFLLLDNDESIQVISQLFNGVIGEDEETFGDQATQVKVNLKIVDKVNEDNMPLPLKKFALKPLKRSNKMTENSYLPLKTFKTVRLSDTLTEEQAAELAKSSFRHFYQVSIKASGKKIEVLRPEDKALINQSEDGKFSSKFFTPDVSSRIPLEIKPAFTSDKEAKLQVIDIPIKEERPSKNGNNPTFKYIAYDCLGKLDTVEAKELNSLAQAKAGKRFSVFYNAAGGEATINEESLKNIKPRRRSNSSKNDEIDNKTIRELLAASLQGRDGALKDEKAPTVSKESLEVKLYKARTALSGEE